MKEFLVYLGGAIKGLNYSEATDWREYVANKVPKYIRTLSPLRAKDYLTAYKTLGDSYADHPLSTEKGINTRDYFDVQRSDALFINLLKTTKVSIGTVMEIAWARAFNKPVVLCMEKGNIHDHGMLNYACGYILPTLDEGIDVLKALLAPDIYLKGGEWN